MTTIAGALSMLSPIILSNLILVEGRLHLEKVPSWRVFALSCAVVNGLLVVLVTELLGALHRLEFGWVLAAWVLLVTAQLPFWRRLIRTIRNSRTPSAPLNGVEIALIVPVVVIALFTGLIALGSAPNNWDSLTYHLTRVAHWKQNGSLAYFPTSNERQLCFPPFAEYAILNLQLLTGGDRFAALVQWLSFVGSLLGVSLIAAQFGACRRGQLLAVVFAATLPIAILEASSTQNDLVMVFWMVCFCYFSISFLDLRSRFGAVASSGALGLALLTKATTYLLVPGFALGFLIVGLRRHGLRLLPPLLGGLVLATAVPAAFFARNYSATGAIVGSPSAQSENAIGRIGATRLISNLLRGAALHASAPPGRIELPGRVKAAIEALERRMNFHSSDKTLDGADWRQTLASEDRAGAPLHFLFVLAALAALCVTARRWRIPRFVSWYGVALGIGVLMLSAYLRWNPYMVRFHGAMFILAAPIVGLIASHMQRARIALPASALLILASAYPLFWNQLRPLLGERRLFTSSRAAEYLAARDIGTKQQMLETIDYLKARHDPVIGVQLGDDSYEYPLWALIPRVSSGTTHICHVDVSNWSKHFESSEECRPTIIVSDDVTVAVVSANAVPFDLRWRDGNFGIYLPRR